jgi:hypothetical protein
MMEIGRHFPFSQFLSGCPASGRHFVISAFIIQHPALLFPHGEGPPFGFSVWIGSVDTFSSRCHLAGCREKAIITISNPAKGE